MTETIKVKTKCENTQEVPAASLKKEDDNEF